MTSSTDNNPKHSFRFPKKPAAAFSIQQASQSAAFYLEGPLRARLCLSVRVRPSRIANVSGAKTIRTWTTVADIEEGRSPGNNTTLLQNRQSIRHCLFELGRQMPSPALLQRIRLGFLLFLSKDFFARNCGIVSNIYWPDSTGGPAFSGPTRQPLPKRISTHFRQSHANKSCTKR